MDREIERHTEEQRDWKAYGQRTERKKDINTYGHIKEDWKTEGQKNREKEMQKDSG